MAVIDRWSHRAGTRPPQKNELFIYTCTCSTCMYMRTYLFVFVSVTVKSLNVHYEIPSDFIDLNERKFEIENLIILAMIIQIVRKNDKLCVGTLRCVEINKSACLRSMTGNEVNSCFNAMCLVQ